MLTRLRENWWLITLRGVAGVLFGLVTFLMPGMSLAVLIGFFGAYVLVDGVFSLASAIRRRREGTSDGMGMLIFEGIVGVLAGIGTWFWPGMTALAMVFYIAAWALVTGAAEIVAAVRLRREIEGEWMLGLAGLASMVFGVLLFVRPAVGALALLWLIGAYALAFGLLLIGLSISLRVGSRRGRPPRLAHA